MAVTLGQDARLAAGHGRQATRAMGKVTLSLGLYMCNAIWVLRRSTGAMGLTLDGIVPWGRSYEEYIGMFDLSASDLGLPILGCGDGPAGFNAKLTKRGGRVVSCDPLYAFDAAQIRDRICETYEAVMTQMCENRSDYVWSIIPSIDELGRIRMSAMNAFLADFEVGKREGRYVTAKLPSLPFRDGEFDIGLCSHFLFLYSLHLSQEFHVRAIEEMTRVAREVRIFPMLTLDGKSSPHVGPVVKYFSDRGFRVTLK